MVRTLAFQRHCVDATDILSLNTASHSVEFIHSLSTRQLCYTFPSFPKSPASSLSPHYQLMNLLPCPLRKWKQHKPTSAHTAATSNAPGCIWTPGIWIPSCYFGDGSVLPANASLSRVLRIPPTSIYTISSLQPPPFSLLNHQVFFPSLEDHSHQW